MKLITLFAVLLLGACAYIPPSKESLSVPEPGYRNYSELSYLPLPQSEELSFKVDGTSQAFAFPEGNSYLAAFKLPKIELGTTLELKTYMSSSYLPVARVFLPQILVLDAKKMPLRLEKDLVLKQDVNFFKGGYWSTSIQLKMDDAYLIIYTAAPKLGQGIPRYNRSSGYAYLAGGSAVFVPGTNSVREIPFVNEGAMEIRLRALRDGQAR
jgi:maltose operon protein